MIVTKDLIKKISKNASLEITDEETEMFMKNFTTIGDWIEKIKNVDISNTEPTINPLYDQDNINLVNNDDAEEVYNGKIFSNTKHHDGEYFLVNKVIK
jgi:aspartyl-tRNA(Asn)/glutamyl-tRNA(Gln) amidotransferase subunit C